MSSFPLIFQKNNKFFRQRGFTLVELLIAISIFSVISIAIYSTFSSGASILRRIKNVDFTRQVTLLRIEKFSRELRTQPSFKKQLFQGSKDRVSFAGLADQFPCRLTYYFDPVSNCLMRAADKMDQITTSDGRFDPEIKAKPLVFLSKIKGVNFSYLYLNPQNNLYNWAEELSSDYTPAAVKFTIITDKEEYASTAFLPTS